MYSEKKSTEVWMIRRQWMEFRSRDRSLESKSSNAIMVFKEYSSKAAIHGVKYIFKDGSLTLDRLLWVVAVVVCAVGVVFLSVPICEDYFTSPLLTSVESTHYPLYELPFPAVTICINKVKRRAGEEILARYLNVTLTPEWRNYTWHVMSILSKFGHPYLHLMKEHLQIAAPILHLFKGLNLTHFMLQVFPRCDEVFLRCFWYGHSMNCCQIFNLQRTEGGFCYSFNSLTAENKRHCSPKHFDDSSDSGDFPECRLRHNAQSGTTTGLEVFLRPLDVDDQLEGKRSGIKGLILLHNPLEVPDISQSFHLVQSNYTKQSIKVSPTLIQSDVSVRNLGIRERSCVFPGEVRLKTHPNMYTLRNCLMECRFQFFGEKCGCYPYIYYRMGDLVSCTLEQYSCLAGLNTMVRVAGPPPGTPGFPEDTPFRCPHCLTPCEEVVYRAVNSLEVDSNPDQSGTSGYLDIYFEEGGAVKYRRSVKMTRDDLLVNIGTLASLFLGISILSVIEMFYYVTKTCRALLGAAASGRTRRSVEDAFIN